MPEILLAAKVAFRRLNPGVTEQELNLPKLTATSVTQLCAGSSQIVRGDMVQARFFAAIPYHVPHHVLGDTLAPHILLTARNILSSVISAAEVHKSSACLVHSGIGTVRMCPPFAD